MSELDVAQPLAWDFTLSDIAHGHSQTLIALDVQQHDIGSNTFVSRLEKGGYDYASAAENIYAYSENDPGYTHAGFMIDWGYDAEDFLGGTIRSDFARYGDGMQDPAGHRLSIMNVNFTEVGIDATPETNPNTEVGEMVVTQNFGFQRDENPRLVGVIVQDDNENGFYDIGEGVGGVTVTVRGNGVQSTTSWSSGGYQIELEPGTYTVTFSGASLSESVSRFVTIDQSNVKEDIYLSPSRSVADVATPAGQFIEGTSGRNELAGTHGNDIIRALGGNDVILGSPGSDQIDGGTGIDTFRSISSRDASLIEYTSTGEIRIQDRFTDFGSDRLENIEFIAFANSSDQLPIYDSLGDLTTAEWTSLVEIYTAYFNRAPDVVGLMFWADQLAGGMDLQTIAEFFFDQPETRAAYSNPNNATVFVTEVYDNVLGRTPDPAGFDFWVSMLEQGFVTQGAFVLEIIKGAKAGGSQGDVAYLAGKTALGIEFGAKLGMDDVQAGLDVFEAFGPQAQSNYAAAEREIDASYAEILETGGLLVDMSAYFDDAMTFWM